MSLIVVAMLSILVERQVSALRDEIHGTVDPAREHVREIQTAFALETGGTRGYLLTGERRYAVDHRAARVRRMQSVTRLHQLTRDAGPEIRGLVTQLEQLLRPADAVLDSLYLGQLSRAEFQLRLPQQQARLQAVTATTRQIGNSISSHAADRLAAVQRTERTAAALTLALVVLALTAAVLVARLGIAMRRTAQLESDARAASERAYAESERRRREVDAISESRNRLMRGFTHDVKNPLVGVAGLLALLQEGVYQELSAQQAETVGRARRSLSTAMALIDDLLQLAQAEAGQLVLHRERFDLVRTCVEAVEEQHAPAQSKGLALHVDAVEAVYVESDQARIRQIVVNLISNAIKYTAAGSITVRTGVKNPPDGWAFVEVVDTGPGIPHAEQQLLFEEFKRLDHNGSIDGVGLGLAISLRLARALGGDIRLSSEVGAGATFTLLLPHAQQAADAPPSVVPETA